MRFHARRAVRSLGVMSCLGLITYGLSGCGGGSSDPPKPSVSPSVGPSPTVSASPLVTPSPMATATPTPPSTPARARLTIAWGDRSRVAGLSSALSARIVLVGAKDGGGDLVFTAERPAVIGAPSVEYVSSDNAVTGRPFPLTVTFFADVRETGDVVGTAQASATVKLDGSIDATIATYGRIRSVVVVPNQTVMQGQSTPLQYSGLDADGRTRIMVRPGSARVTVVSGSDRLAVDGDNLRGIKPRDASVVVSIDQATSAATPVFVSSDAIITPNTSALTLSIEKTFSFSAVVTGANVTDSTITWALVGAPSDVSLTPSGVLTVGRTEASFTVTGTSNYDPDPAKVVRIPVTVASKVTVAIQNKAGAIVGIGDKLPLTAVVSDPDGPLSQTAVSWQVVDKATGKPVTGFGTIDSGGVYTAPNVAGSYRVVATSLYDTRKSDFVDVDVRAGTIGVGVQ